MTPLTPSEVPAECLPAINAIYAELRFEPSGTEHTTWWIRRHDKPVALGRIRRLGSGDWEIGGFWTAPDCRRQGHAGRLVEHAMRAVPKGARGWCLPLPHLVDFYRSFGMRTPQPAEIPAFVAARRQRCADDGHGTEPLTFLGGA